jgi:hypothetical protein
LLILALVSLVCVTIAGIVLLAPTRYDQKIYPGISVGPVDVGALTRPEAVAALRAGLPQPDEELVELRAGEHAWRVSWAELGQTYDYEGMAAEAFAVGREGGRLARRLAVWRLRRQGRDLPPIVIPPPAARVDALLERAAPLITAPPTEAQLTITSVGVQAQSGHAGTTLGVADSRDAILEALSQDGREVTLVMQELPPRVASPEPAHSQAQSLLAEPFTLLVDDVLTDYRIQFDVPPAQMASWLRPVPDHSGQGRLTLTFDEEAVRAWVQALEPQLGSERVFDGEETTARIVEALASGEHRAQAAIRHPPRTYVVQPGDNMFDIAYSHGFPHWWVEEANPDVEPGSLAIGMELTIPSIDVLFPEPLVPGKRIEISLPEQRLRAYEDDQLLYEFTASSGMSSTPTIAGQFQVLFKEEQAYAPRWELEMPYFMAIYQEGPEFYNGIHELPINAAGNRLWSSVLGWPASYGCIILDLEDAESLYNWAPVGTLVRITGVAPGTPTYEERVAQIESEQAAPEEE